MYHLADMILGSPQCLNCCFLNWKICCYPYSSKLGDIGSKIIQFWRTAIYAHVATTPSSHQVDFGEAIQKNNRKIFGNTSNPRKCLIKHYFIVYLITNYIQVMLGSNIYDIL